MPKCSTRRQPITAAATSAISWQSSPTPPHGTAQPFASNLCLPPLSVLVVPQDAERQRGPWVTKAADGGLLVG